MYLVALDTDQLYTLSKWNIDPRRPLFAPTSEEKEESLFPINPISIINPTPP